ncbi:MAG: SRPBCC family protein [Betaproteobacteria bacterium]|nr:SRPBCC family protein [Betaproteobacteria bacterium]
MIKVLLIVLAVFLLSILLVVGIGMLLPQSHVVARSMVLKQKREDIYALISEMKNAPAWRKDIEAVEEVKGEFGETLYREKSNHGLLTYRVVKREAPQKFVTTIADKDAPFGGSWIFYLVEEGGGTRLTINERGEVYNPVFRFMAKFVFGHHRTMETYLADVAKRFSEVAAVQEGVAGQI